MVVAAWREGGDLLCRVSDTGKGIGQADIAKIFEPEFTKGKKSGTGLGLAHCRQVVEAHGGEIGVESEAGNGAAFTLKFPVCVLEAAVEA